MKKEAKRKKVESADILSKIGGGAGGTGGFSFAKKDIANKKTVSSLGGVNKLDDFGDIG